MGCGASLPPPHPQIVGTFQTPGKDLAAHFNREVGISKFKSASKYGGTPGPLQADGAMINVAPDGYTKYVIMESGGTLTSFSGPATAWTALGTAGTDAVGCCPCCGGGCGNFQLTDLVDATGAAWDPKGAQPLHAFKLKGYLVARLGDAPSMPVTTNPAAVTG